MATSPPPTTRSPGQTPTPTAPLSNASSPPTFDPKVAELQIMFPSVDVAVITLILESVGGSQDRAIEQLLSMTDPNFQPDEIHTRTEEESQLNLDEQFARSLAMQDEQEAQRSRSAAPGAGAGAGGLPYEPRVRRNRGPPPGQYSQHQPQQADQFYQPGSQGQGQGQNPPGMIALEDKLGQYAEVGKQTFNSLFSKAKAKYSEFQQTHAATTNSPDRARESTWGDSSHESWRHPDSAYGTPTPGGGRGGEQNKPRGMWDERSSRSESFSSQSTIDPGPTPISPHSAANPPLRQSAARWKPSDAYEDAAPPLQRNSSSSNRIEVAGAGRRSPAVGSPDKGAGVGKIDPAKLGMLPKKRVDLLSTSPPPSTPKAANVINVSHGATVEDEEDDPNPSLPSASKSLVSQIPKTPPAGHNPYTLGDSDDDLEYTKNPFDEK